MPGSLPLASGFQRQFPTPGPRQWFLILAALAGASILIPTTLLLLGYLLLKIGSYSPVFTVFYAPYYFLMVICADLARYLALNLGVIIVVFTALRWAKPGRWTTMWLVASLVAILLHPFTLGSYHPALRAQPERRMIVPTQPALFVASAVKQAQVATEARPCTYHLVGWALDGRFYYESACGEIRIVWSIDPADEVRPARTRVIPMELAGRAAQPEESLAYMQAPGVRPADLEPVTRSIYLVEGEVMQSRDGRWLALVSQHLYGPQDVLLIQIADNRGEDS